MLLGLLRRRRARRTAALPPPEPPAPAFDAPARLHAIEARVASDPVADVVEVADVLRRHVEQRFGVRTAERTSEELLAAVPAGARAALADLLTRCDPVRYAALAPTTEQRTALLDAALVFVKAGNA
jgi:hypothetical protein